MKILLAPEAAALLRITADRACELAKRGVIPCVRVGRQVRFCEEQLLEWIATGGSSLEYDKTSFIPITNLASSVRR